MPQRSKGARLYLRKRAGREPVYVILDGAKEVGTGCGPGDVAAANEALRDYLARTFRPDTGQRDLAQITVAEVLTLYAQEVAAHRKSAGMIGYNMKALLPFWGGKSLADVKGSTCRKYVEFRSDSGSSRRPVKPAASRRELKTLSAAINHWHRESPALCRKRTKTP
ncbi:MAG: hypothetical protein KDE30_00525 [Novosphingobium sp.]|nr:hypothetical protein [Novosphingobium sp.]